MKILKNKKGFSVLEIILASTLFLIMAIAISSLLAQTYQSNRGGNEQTVASQYAAEGIDAIRSIKNRDFTLLANTSGSGISIVGGVWAFSGTSTIFDNEYIRTVAITDVYRDVNGNIVSTGGTLDSSTKRASSTVVWSPTPGKTNSVVLTSYFTNWEAAYGVGRKNGMLVYGDGGSSVDTIKYRIFNAATNSWGTAANALDVESTSTNLAVRSIRIFSSPTRNEKVLITKHFNSSNQMRIYAQVWNGSAWGNLNNLTTYTASSFVDNESFSGTYLANGNFMTAYSDNTTTPKFKVWNGTIWGAATSTRAVTAAPSYLILKARAGTNEVMMAVYGTSQRTQTSYYDGLGDASTDWSAVTSHATAGPSNSKRIIDFDWSPSNPTKGMLFYSDSATDRLMNSKTFTANGTGGGTWSSTVNGTQQSGTATLGAMVDTPRNTSAEFLNCSVVGTANAIYCQEATSTPAWSVPTNSTVATSSGAGNQRTMAIEFENLSDTYGIIVYSVSSTVPMYKKYNPTTNTFDANHTAMTAVSSTVKSVRSAFWPGTDDIMFTLTDNNRRLYSYVWDGTNNVMYSTPPGLAQTVHGINGSSGTEMWYDFAWDLF